MTKNTARHVPRRRLLMVLGAMSVGIQAVVIPLLGLLCGAFAFMWARFDDEWPSLVLIPFTLGALAAGPVLTVAARRLLRTCWDPEDADGDPFLLMTVVIEVGLAVVLLLFAVSEPASGPLPTFAVAAAGPGLGLAALVQALVASRWPWVSRNRGRRQGRTMRSPP